MNRIHFEWDETKNDANMRKHGVSFQDAGSAFYDEQATVYYDPEHSVEEDRFILLGMSCRAGVLVVCHCFKKDDSIIRIISARKATKHERMNYKGDAE